MTAVVSRWSHANLATAIRVLGAHDSLDAGIQAVAAALGFAVTRQSLDGALRKAGHPTAYALLRSHRRAVPHTARVPAPSCANRETPEIPVEWDEPPPAPKSEAELLDEDISEHRERSELAALRAAKKRLVQELDDAREQMSALKALRAARPPLPIVERKIVGATQRQGVPVMLCSDWHVEEPVDPRTVNGLNEYTLDIADACITRMAEAFEWMLRDPRYDCRAGVVWLGGDLYSGHIHEELVESCFLSPTQAVLWLQDRIERMLRTIAATCPQLERIIVPCTDGNHGRLTHKTRISTRTKNSLEWLLYQTLAARLADDPRFEFDIADGEWVFVDLYERTYAFTHGDSFRYGGGVGGISIPLRRGINEMRKYRRIDHVSLGHFHQRSDFGDITVNGSMIGLGPYSMHLHASPEPRQQSWFLVDSKRGKSISAPIWL